MHDLLKRAQLAELRELRKAARQERRRDLWVRWVAFWDRLGKNLKVAAAVVGGVSALAAGVPAGIKGGTLIVHGVHKAWALYHARDIDLVLPAPTGVPSTALDFWGPGYKKVPASGERAAGEH